MYAAISSLSLSLLATGIDSVFDIGSNVLLFWLHRKAAKLDVNKWPVGGARLETIGNIVYGMSILLTSHRLIPDRPVLSLGFLYVSPLLFEIRGGLLIYTLQHGLGQPCRHRRVRQDSDR